MAKYLFGSSDSLDFDVCYAVDEVPSLQECKEREREMNRIFAEQGLPPENINFVKIEDGVVVDTYKGTPDEMNNALYYTYDSHIQMCDLLVTRPVTRCIRQKDERVVRIILSRFSRIPELRADVKRALRAGFMDSIAVLSKIDIGAIDFSGKIGKNDGVEVLKTIAFQIGQALGLHEDCEWYEKRTVAEGIPELRPYLYRETTDTTELEKVFHRYIKCLQETYCTTVDGD